MNKKKYEILYDQHKEVYGIGTVYRICALISFGEVAAGTLGEWVQNYNNLSQEGNCWIDDDAIVCESAKVKDNAQVLQNASVLGNAIVFDNAKICENAVVCGAASVGGESLVSDFAVIKGEAKVRGSSFILNLTLLKDSSMVVNCVVKNDAQLVGETSFYDQEISETPIQVQIRDFWCYKNPEELYTIGYYSFSRNDLKEMLKDRKTFLGWDYFKLNDYEAVLLAFNLLSGEVQEAMRVYMSL